jgi:peptidase M42 family hydrolase
MKDITIDTEYLQKILLSLLRIPSPSGYTDQIVHFVGEELSKFDMPVELTRRGAIRSEMKGDIQGPHRAVVVHLDTLGAMVKSLKPNGRLQVVPIGSWNARFAEGTRVTIFRDQNQESSRGTILPLKASGHTYNTEVDEQPVSWDNCEIRVDEFVQTKEDLEKLGFNTGDFVAIDPSPEITPNGFINSRHLDNKAGVATLLAVIKALKEAKVSIPLDCDFVFTISEEVGSGASGIFLNDVMELVSIDNSTPAVIQNSTEFGVTIGMMDSTGPFDYHLTRKLIDICKKNNINHTRDLFRYYRCDAASAIEAGNDIRTALACFGCDSSHGWERCHISSLESLAQLLCRYTQSEPTFKRDKAEIGSLSDFPRQPEATFEQLKSTEEPPTE